MVGEMITIVDCRYDRLHAYSFILDIGLPLHEFVSKLKLNIYHSKESLKKMPMQKTYSEGQSACPSDAASFPVTFSADGSATSPQPVQGDDLDPLNWSKVQKHVILAIVMGL